MKISLFDETKFLKHHTAFRESKSQKDVFFIWMLIMFISVVAAHFILNFTGGSPTGFVTAAQSTIANTSLFLGALLVVFVVILIIAIIHIGITKKDY